MQRGAVSEPLTVAEAKAKSKWGLRHVSSQAGVVNADRRRSPFSPQHGQERHCQTETYVFTLSSSCISHILCPSFCILRLVTPPHSLLDMLMDSARNSDIEGLSCHGSQQIHASFFSVLKMLFHLHSRRKISRKTLNDDVEGQVLLTGCALPPARCVFCGASKENGFNVIWEVWLPSLHLQLDHVSQFPSER